MTTDGMTTYINASTCTLRYTAINAPIIFDVPIPPGHSKDDPFRTLLGAQSQGEANDRLGEKQQSEEETNSIEEKHDCEGTVQYIQNEEQINKEEKHGSSGEEQGNEGDSRGEKEDIDSKTAKQLSHGEGQSNSQTAEQLNQGDEQNDQKEKLRSLGEDESFDIKEELSEGEEGICQGVEQVNKGKENDSEGEVECSESEEKDKQEDMAGKTVQFSSAVSVIHNWSFTQAMMYFNCHKQ